MGQPNPTQRHEPEEREDGRNAQLRLFQDFVRMLLAQDLEPQLRTLMAKLLPPETPASSDVPTVPNEFSAAELVLKLPGVRRALQRLPSETGARQYVNELFEAARRQVEAERRAEGTQANRAEGVQAKTGGGE